MSFGDSVKYGNVHVKRTENIAAGILKKKKFYNKSKYAGLVGAWKNVIGEEIYAATRIISYNHGKLKIAVNSPIVLHELKGFMKRSVLEELRRTDGGEDVVEIIFMAG